MTIQQTPKGLYYVQWMKDGVRSKRYFGRGDIAREQAIRFDLGLQLERGKLPTHSLSVSVLCRMYHQQHPVEESTGINNDYKFAVLLRHLGHLPADMLSSKELGAYVQTRLEQGKKRATIAREIGLLKAAFSWAEEQDPPLISRNSCRKFRVPRVSDKDVPIPPSGREIGLILDHAEPHLRRAILLSWYCGIRPGPKEALAITWGDVNLDREIIRVVGARKGGPVIRYAPIPAALKKELAIWAKADKEHIKDMESTPVIHYHGKPIRSLKTAWSTAKKNAGITRRLRPYDLRHAMVTQALAAGADLKSVSEVIGHSRPDTTLREYQHVTREQHRKVVDLIPEIGGVTWGNAVGRKPVK